MVLLDKVLMEAGGIKAPSKTMWGRLTRWIRRKTRPARTLPEREILQHLTKRLGRTVFALTGPMCIGHQSG